ncbi:hypothetical protein ANN_14403 [Periplaneta americana]|uniref:Uncharacterized protein n=1 Tax=Periplaneta americana TaxID=6978 RepID=A0ABQ8SWU2_PERAM|nr:hypothetical protein ANN_14403 [Periplaneta americana]
MSFDKKQCAAVNCNSTSSITHPFPKDFKRCQQWAERAGCLHLLEKGVDVLHAEYRLCSDHFHDSSYLSRKRKKLSIYALPEIFSEETECKPADVQIRRQSEELPHPMCRLCACMSTELVSVFEEKGLELQLLEKIHVHLPIMVTSEDLLPVTLCTTCIWKLELCHEFVVGCLSADTKLKSIYELENSEVGFSTHSQLPESYDAVKIKEKLLENGEYQTMEDSVHHNIFIDPSYIIDSANEMNSTDHQVDVALKSEEDNILLNTYVGIQTNKDVNEESVQEGSILQISCENNIQNEYLIQNADASNYVVMVPTSLNHVHCENSVKSTKDPLVSNVT